MAKNKVHIGKKIKDALDQSPMSVVDFAKSINITRNGAYKIFDRETIDTAQLQKISTVLQHDFFRYYNTPLDARLAKESKGDYGYATKEELSNLTHTVQILVHEIEKLRGALSVNSKKPYRAKTSRAKK